MMDPHSVLVLLRHASNYTLELNRLNRSTVLIHDHYHAQLGTFPVLLSRH